MFPRTSVWIQHDGKPAFLADPTRVTLYNPQQAYSRQINDPRGDRCEWFGVSRPVLREMIRSVDPARADEDQLFRYDWGSVSPALYLRQRRLYEYLSRDATPDELLVEETSIGILIDVLRSVYASRGAVPAARKRTQQDHREVVEAARAHLARTFRDTESLSAIATGIGVSMFHLCRVFRSLTGTTIHSHRNQLRLRESLERLVSSRDSLVTIADDLGFSSHSHFTAAFRRNFSCAPSQLRTSKDIRRGDRLQLIEQRTTRVGCEAAPPINGLLDS